MPKRKPQPEEPNGEEVDNTEVMPERSSPPHQSDVDHQYASPARGLLVPQINDDGGEVVLQDISHNVITPSRY